MRRLATLLALAIAAPASADYVFDPADLPRRYECDEGWSAERCDKEKRREGWWTAYNKRYDVWYHELLFNTDIYFEDDLPPKQAQVDTEDLWEAEKRLSPQTRNLVDAIYSVALRRYSGGWAFAIQMVCPASTEPTRATCAPKLRMVRFRTDDEIALESRQQLEILLPTSMAETASEIRLTAHWDEADLRTCPGAISRLLALPAQRGEKLWHSNYAQWLRGQVPKSPNEIIVTTDGSGVFIRARGKGDPSSARLAVGGAHVTYSQWNGGAGMAWAQDMADVVRPCLKPANAPAPWDKIVAAGQDSKPSH